MARGFLSRGILSGGFCLGGFCPRTEKLVTVIKYGTSITVLRVLLKEGEIRCNINDLTPLDVEVTHYNQGEGEIKVISQDSYSKIPEKLFERVTVDSFYKEAGTGRGALPYLVILGMCSQNV